MEFKVSGVGALKDRLSRAVRDMPRQAGAALYAEAQAIREKSMGYTPVMTGTLRASHVVRGPFIENDSITVEIAVGGAATPYAIAVHEHLSEHSPPSWKAAEESGSGVHFHPDGTGPKFLERALLEALPGMDRRLADLLDAERLGT